MTQRKQPASVSSTDPQGLGRTWANAYVKCVRQHTVRQETTLKCKAGPLPFNMNHTAVHQRERLEFAPENEDQNHFSRNIGSREQVRFHQGILEAIRFLNMMKTPLTVNRTM